MRRAIVLTLLALSCGRGPPLTVQNDAAADPSAPAWARGSSTPARVVADAVVAARAWRGASGDLDGWTIRLTDMPIMSCGGQTIGAWGYLGCTEYGTITLRLDNSACIEATNLAHEVGHVVIDDPGHADPRWHDPAFWDQIRTALLASVPADDADCATTLASPEWFYDRNQP
jgi:hypothetical protein